MTASGNRAARLGLLLVAAAALALTACGGGSSGGPTTNFAGGPSESAGAVPSATSTLGGATKASGKSSSAGTVRVSTLPGGRRTTISVGGNGGGSGGGGGGSGGGGGAGGGSGGGSGGSTCTAAAPPLASDPSKAVITVCPGRSLANDQVVTITGSHFKANEALLYMQCHYKGENANNYGPNDCNLNILNLGANSTKSSASGTVGPITLKMHTKFKSVDCAAVQCMVTVAVAAQNGVDDNPHALIYFS